jgi:transposase InsO family protein
MLIEGRKHVLRSLQTPSRCHQLLLVFRTDRTQGTSRLCAATTTARQHHSQPAPRPDPRYAAGLHITADWAEYVLCAAAHNTYIPTWQGWVYLATVIDCHTKAVIGWAMDDNYKTPLIEQAIEMAASNYPLAENAIFHSDRGSNARFNESLQQCR